MGTRLVHIASVAGRRSGKLTLAGRSRMRLSRFIAPTRRLSSSCMYDDERTMGKTAANHQPLTPLRFLERSASTWPDHPACAYGPTLSRSYRELYARTRQLASMLEDSGVSYGSPIYGP